QPRSMKPRDDTANTMKFLDRMLTVFLARAKPASTDANPRFMKNTRMAASSTHKVSMIMAVSINSSLCRGGAARCTAGGSLLQKGKGRSPAALQPPGKPPHCVQNRKGAGDHPGA